MLSGPVVKVTTEHQEAIASLDNGQRSLLLVAASTITGTSPHLEGLWLATYFPTDTTIQFMPIYAAGNNTLSSLEQQLELTFQIDQTGSTPRLGEEFLRLLEENNYWWSGYIVFDEVSLAKATQQTGDVAPNGKAVTDTAASKASLRALEDPLDGYSSQVALLQSMCRQINTGTAPGVAQWISLIPSHILTDLDASQLQVEWETLASNPPDRTCRFPTLEISRVEQ